jgi:polar amino acid transport system permease protein
MRARLVSPASIRDLLCFGLTIVAVVWLMVRGSEQMGYSWHWRQIPRAFFTLVDGQVVAGPLLQGLGVTLEITALSLVAATAIGLTTALLRLSDSFGARIVVKL